MRRTYCNPKLMVIVSTVVVMLFIGSLLPKIHAFQSISTKTHRYFGLKSQIIIKTNHVCLAQGVHSTDMVDGFMHRASINFDSVVPAPFDVSSNLKQFYQYSLSILDAVPQMAAELERQARELYPDLWAEYEAKLQPGETLVNRLDLMQDLGNEFQKRQLAELDRQAAAAAATAKPSKSQEDADDGIDSSTKANSVIIDAKVVKSDGKEK